MAFRRRIYFDTQDHDVASSLKEALSDIVAAETPKMAERMPQMAMMSLIQGAEATPKVSKKKLQDAGSDALAKIAQIIPGEILGAYGAALNTLQLFDTQQQPWVALLCYFLGIVGTGWYTGWCMGDGIKKRKHILVYASAFAIWAYSLTGKTALPWIYHPGIAALLPIIAGVVFAGISLRLEPKKK